MDIDDTRWVEPRGHDQHRETDGGRDDFEEPWYWLSPKVLEDLGTNEDTGDDVRRRERMAEAMYEC